MAPKVAFLMANYGHDPTGEARWSQDVLQCSFAGPETVIPYNEFKKAGFEIDFVTEKGNMPECDAKMLTGMTQKLLVCYLVAEFTQDIWWISSCLQGRYQRGSGVV